MGPGKGQEGLRHTGPACESVSKPGARRQPIRAFCARGPALLAPCEPTESESTAAETGARHCSSPSLGGAAQAVSPVGAPCPAREAQARGVASAHLLPSLSRLLRRSERRDSSLRSVEIVSAAAASPLRASCARRALLPSDAGGEAPIRPPCCTSRACKPAGPPTRVTNEAVRPPTGQQSKAAVACYSACHTTTSLQRALRRGLSSPAVPTPSIATIRSCPALRAEGAGRK